MITAAEIKVDGKWVAIGHAEAKALEQSKSKPVFRCPRCHGRMNTYTGGGAKPHFGHYEAHPGCKATPPVLHSKALA